MVQRLVSGHRGSHPHPAGAGEGGDAHLILADGCSLTAQRGINLLEGDSLTIYGQQAGTGTLTATGAMHGESGIGGQYKENNSSAFTMNGGFVTAQGGNYAAGIGGAWDGVGLNVVFNGGYVEVTGNIGAGYDNSDAGSFTTGPDCDGVLAVSGGTQITVNGDGATLTPDGELQLPEGGSLTVDTGAGTVTVTPPAVKNTKSLPQGKPDGGLLVCVEVRKCIADTCRCGISYHLGLYEKYPRQGRHGIIKIKFKTKAE